MTRLCLILVCAAAVAVSSVHATTCSGATCSPTAFCRSQWGFCGNTSDYCNAQSTWIPECLSRTGSPTVPTQAPTDRPVTPTAPTTLQPTTTQSPGYVQEVGTYFAQWGIYGEAFYVSSLETSGQAQHLTYINYAFANVYAMADGTFQCQSNITRTESGQGDGGDSYADYGWSVGANESVDGVADVWSQTLKGNYNQLKKL